MVIYNSYKRITRKKEREYVQLHIQSAALDFSNNIKNVELTDPTI